MDIHKPRPLHSFREFLIEIGTITLGILIALALEGAVEAGRHRELADRARADMRAELTLNRRNLAEIVQAAKAEQGVLKTFIGYGEARLAHRKGADIGKVDLSGDFTSLSTAAFENAVATQALTYMPFRQAEALSRVYSASRVFNAIEDRAEERWFELSAYPTDPASMTDGEIAEALATLRVALTYQQSVAATGAFVLTAYDQALARLQD